MDVSWSIKQAESRRIDAFELWCWRRLLRVPWTAEEIQPVHSEGDQSWVFFGRNDAKAEPGDLPDPRIEPGFPALQGVSLFHLLFKLSCK